MTNTYQFRRHLSLNAATVSAGTALTTGQTTPINKLLLTAYGGNVQLRFDGILPLNPTDGQRVLEGQAFEVEMRLGELQQLRIRSFVGSVSSEVDLFEEVI